MLATNTAYTTAQEVAVQAGIIDSQDDPFIDSAILAASRQIDAYCGQFFYQDEAVTTREFYTDSSTRLDLMNQPGSGLLAPISTASGLIVKTDDAGTGAFDTTLTVNTQFLLSPRNAEDEGRGYTEIFLPDTVYFPSLTNGRAPVQITAKFGWPTVPDEVVKACLIQAAQLWKAKDAPFGVVSFGDAGISRMGAGLHIAAKALLAGLRLPAVG